MERDRKMRQLRTRLTFKRFDDALRRMMFESKDTKTKQKEALVVWQTWVRYAGMGIVGQEEKIWREKKKHNLFFVKGERKYWRKVKEEDRRSKGGGRREMIWFSCLHFLVICLFSISSVGRGRCVGRIGADSTFGMRGFVLLVELLDGLDLFLELHASVLEPNFDLALCQA